MTIKLNEFDKKLLSQITPASKWDKLKSIYAINSVIKQLKIGNKKIGLKCAKHLQKLSKQNTTSLQEIREGCRDLKIPKQKLPLAKDKTKREVESVHKINKATDKAPTDKTTGGGGGRKGGRGGGGAAQPQADLIGGLFTAFKAQEAKQARDSQFNELERQRMVNQQIPQGTAGDALRQRMQGPAAQQYLDALKEGSDISRLSQGENLLYRELLNERILADQAKQYSVSGQSMNAESLNLLSELERKRFQLNEQDLTNVSIPPTPRSSSSMFNPTTEEKNKLAMDLLEQREKNLSSLESSVERKQGLFRNKMEEANIYKEQQRQSMIQNQIGINTENYINKQRKEITNSVLNKNMNNKEAQQKLQQLNTFYLKQLNYEQQQRVNKNIFNDIEEIERDRQFKLRNRKVGVDSVLSRLRNNETQEQQDRLVNDLIINQNEKKMKDIQSELLGSVSSRAIEKQKGKENRQQQIDLLRTRMQNQNVVEQETQGFTFNPPTNPDLSSIQQNVLTNVEDRLEQQNADRVMREFVSRQNLNEFNQQSQPLGLTRTSSSSLLDRMQADSLRQSREIEDLQRTLSADDKPRSLVLDVERAKKKLKEAIFNRKQKELAQQIQNLKIEEAVAKPIQKKESPREEKSFDQREGEYFIKKQAYDMLEGNQKYFKEKGYNEYERFLNFSVNRLYNEQSKYATPEFIKQIKEDYEKGVPLGERPKTEKEIEFFKDMEILEPIYNKIYTDIRKKTLTNIPKNERFLSIDYPPGKTPPIVLRSPEEIENAQYRLFFKPIYNKYQDNNSQQFDNISQLQSNVNHYNNLLRTELTKDERVERGLKPIDFDKEYLPLIPEQYREQFGYWDMRNEELVFDSD